MKNRRGEEEENKDSRKTQGRTGRYADTQTYMYTDREGGEQVGLHKLRTVDAKAIEFSETSIIILVFVTKSRMTREDLSTPTLTLIHPQPAHSQWQDKA